MSEKRRDYYLDFYRGIATLSIIYIHTVFNTCRFAPDIFKTLGLLLDVPFFMYLAGWSMRYSSRPSKVFDNLLFIWIKWIIFISVTDVVMWIVNGNRLASCHVWLEQAVFNVGTSLPDLWIINNSMWFMPMYIKVVLFGCLVINILKHFDLESAYASRITLFLIVGLAYLSITNSGYWFLLPRQLCFFAPLLLLGFYHSNRRIGPWWHCLIASLSILGVWFLTSRLFGIYAKNLQAAKFPPHIMYFVASLLSIAISMFFHGKIDRLVEKCRFLRYIGQNAIAFYFAQGVGSSLLRPIIYGKTPLYDKIGWQCTLALALLINLAISISLGCALSRVFKLVDKAKVWCQHRFANHLT